VCTEALEGAPLDEGSNGAPSSAPGSTRNLWTLKVRPSYHGPPTVLSIYIHRRLAENPLAFYYKYEGVPA